MAETPDKELAALRRQARENPAVHPARRRRPSAEDLRAEMEAEVAKAAAAEAQAHAKALADLDARERAAAAAHERAVAKAAAKAEAEARAKARADAIAQEKAAEKEAAKEAAKTRAYSPKAEEKAKSAPEETPAKAEAAAQAPKSPPTGPIVLALDQIEKTYGSGAGALPVLRGLDFQIHRGEVVGLIGPSGSGKSTLLQIAGLLDAPSGGMIRIEGKPVASLNETARTRLRRENIGFVYQFHHLLKEFSALENVMLPQRLAGVSAGVAKARAAKLLDQVGLSHRQHHRPDKLSGGERQRVAIARALANRPALLLADEPTGNLDPETAEGVFALLLDLAAHEGMAALIATHNLELGNRMDRMVQMAGGTLNHVN